MPAPEVVEASQRSAPEDDVWIAVECRVCHTRMDARPHQVGQKIACPDCHTLATVPPPPPAPKKVQLTAPKETLGIESLAPAPRDVLTGPTTQIVCPHCGFRQTTQVDQLGRKHSCTGCFLIFIPPTPRPNGDGDGEGFDDELKLSDAAPRPKPTLPDFDLDADGDSAAAPAAPFASRPELSRPLGPRPKLPAWPLVSGVFGFPLRPGVWQRWVGLSVGLAAILILVSNAHAVTRGGPGKEWALAILYSGLAVFGAAMWYVFGPAILLAIFQDTAAGNDNVETWPDGPWIDTALEGLYIVCALATAGIVSAGLWEAARFSGIGNAWAATLTGLVGFVAFPVFLLSMIEQGSMLMPVSGPVWGSLISGWKWWAVFLIESLLLDFAVGNVVLAIVRRLPETGIGALQMTALAAVAALFVAFLIIYFRLLGRLAWCCEEVLSLKAADEEEPPRLNDRRPAKPVPQPAPAASQRPRYTGPSDDDDDFLSGI
ncbi:MAG: hypothetical protein U0836_09180 [Pirellulales bacterium]